jgi:hypothetical protein
MIDPDIDGDLRQYATNLIYYWFDVQGKDSGAADEAYEITRSGMSHAEATTALRQWFEDRLLVDPGTPGSFPYGLSGFVGVMLEFVNWDDVVGTMRRREK